VVAQCTLCQGRAAFHCWLHTRASGPAAELPLLSPEYSWLTKTQLKRLLRSQAQAYSQSNQSSSNAEMVIRNDITYESGLGTAGFQLHISNQHQVT
jgi:hypothetical protein